jgi:hypothetical protein
MGTVRIIQSQEFPAPAINKFEAFQGAIEHGDTLDITRFPCGSTHCTLDDNMIDDAGIAAFARAITVNGSLGNLKELYLR